jgi:hypothetical protein
MISKSTHLPSAASLTPHLKQQSATTSSYPGEREIDDTEKGSCVCQTRQRQMKMGTNTSLSRLHENLLQHPWCKFSGLVLSLFLASQLISNAAAFSRGVAPSARSPTSYSCWKRKMLHQSFTRQYYAHGRLMMASTSTSTSPAVTTSTMNEPPKVLVSRGMEAFRQGDVDGSLKYFGAAEKNSDGRLTPYLWQRGLSYYYADKFKEGSTQVKRKAEQ